MSEPSDRDLVQQTRRGETEAFGELVRRYQNSVFNVCYRLTGERRDAEDMTQEAFLRAFQRLGSYDDVRPFGPWIRRVATNICLNHLTSLKAPKLELDDEMDLPTEKMSAHPEARQEVREEAQKVRAALLELPPHYRVVIELRHFQEYSYQEIGEQLGIPLSDVKSHLFRARTSLANKLKNDE